MTLDMRPLTEGDLSRRPFGLRRGSAITIAAVLGVVLPVMAVAVVMDPALALPLDWGMVTISVLLASVLVIAARDGETPARSAAKMAAAEAASESGFIVDRTGRLLVASMRVQSMFGPTAFPVANILKALPARDEAAQAAVRHLLGASRHGEPAEAQVTLILPSTGKEAAYHVQVLPVSEPVGATQWILEPLAAGAVAKIEAPTAPLAATIAQVVPVGLFATDDTGRLLWANDTLAAWLGMSAARVAQDMNLAEILGADAAQLPIAGEEMIEQPVTLRRIDGELLAATLTQRLMTSGGQTHVAGTLIRRMTERRREEPVSLARQRFQRFFEIAPVGIAFADEDAHFHEANPALAAFLASDDLKSHRVYDFVHADDHTALSTQLKTIVSGSGDTMAKPLEIRLNRPRLRNVALFASRLDNDDGSLGGLILYFIDLTEQKNLELQFVQSQKMQAVGQLAGGVAHDFNNLLTAMNGFCDLLLLRFRPGDQSFGDLMQIKQNANRAASLVRQLLAFSRQQTLQPQVIDISEVLSELSHLLNRLLGETVELKMYHGRGLGRVKVDPGQLEQVIINLAVNARDAMPRNGTLTIRTRNVDLAEAIQRDSEFVPVGAYVLIEVSDDGSGIPPDILGRIFEPFFSTKEVGSGTGLGLSTVYGIVKQTGGFVLVDSTMGVGTRFSIYLPRWMQTEAEPPPVQPVVPEATLPRDLTGAGTILLVEDEAPVRMFTMRALQNKGYSVLEAKSGEGALEILAREPPPHIDLIITDVMMPRMDGPTLIEHVRRTLPDVKVIFISGYAEETFAKRLGPGEGVHFLPKPFSLKELAAKVKEIMLAS